MTKKKKTIIIVSSIVGGIIILGIICVIFFILFLGYIFGGYPYKEVQNSISNDKQNQIVIYQKDARGFFGPSDVTIIAGPRTSSKKYRKPKNRYLTKIYDDGGKGSIKIEWKDDNNAYVTLNGCEMEELNISIQFENNDVKFTEEENIKELE